MEFLCADANLRTQAKLTSIGKGRRHVDIYASCIHGTSKVICHFSLFGNDTFAMSRTIFGDMVNGDYKFGYQIYTLLLAISSIDIPNAISKLVSERCALDDYRGAMRIFRVALGLFACVGLLFSAMMFFGAEFIAANILDAPLAKHTIMALSPALIFVSVSSVIRGFFAGQHNMQATNTSQVLEQFLKSLSTILIVLSMAGARPEYMAAGATLATTLSTLLSCIYLFIF